ncbi:hypothetical protein CEXT_80921 [Caerostris extrusa]|uniref:Uncharacterized protein n=1 Tax=Caerostris extrusa TaxID=172846 RepID=A0AAV4M4B8_CAEEX|nr:hypothetical protein CEXT_80921 [Caerostris extrusa]
MAAKFASGVPLPWLRDGERGVCGRSAKATTDAAASLSISLLGGWREVLTDCWGDEESVCDPLAALLISLLHQFKISPSRFPPFRMTPAFIYLGRDEILAGWGMERKSRGVGTSWLLFVGRPEWRQSFASGVSLPRLWNGEERGVAGVPKPQQMLQLLYQSPCTEEGERGAG